MNQANLIRLILLAAIWGASFLFMRMAAPALGPVVMTMLRVGAAALFLWMVARLLYQGEMMTGRYRDFLFLGVVGVATPFTLFGYAAQSLSASIMSILNATAPIWGVVIGVLWYRQAVTWKRAVGLLMGVVGVSILVSFDPTTVSRNALLPVMAVLGATFCYGIASSYAQGVQGVKPFDQAHGSMWGAMVLMLPLLPFFPIREAPSTEVVSAVLLLGVLCTGVAFLLYFRLIKEVGAASTLTVTFLIPLFGVFWGSLLLDEQVGWHTLVGGLFVLTGTAWGTGFNLQRIKLRSTQAVDGG